MSTDQEICLRYLRVLVTSSTFLETRSSSCFFALIADSKFRSSAVLVETSLNSGWRADFVLVNIIMFILSTRMMKIMMTIMMTMTMAMMTMLTMLTTMMLRMRTHCDIFSSASCMADTFCSRSILSDSSSTIAAFNRNVWLLQKCICFFNFKTFDTENYNICWGRDSVLQWRRVLWGLSQD